MNLQVQGIAGGFNLHHSDAFEEYLLGLGLPSDERALLEEADPLRHSFARRRELVFEGKHAPVAYILHEGWACSYKLMPDGTRQIVNLYLPGDFVGLRNLFTKFADSYTEALTDIVVSEISRSKLVGLMQRSNRIMEAILSGVFRDQAIAAQHITNIGRRSALLRTGHLLLEISARLARVGVGTAEQYELPISQRTLADILGISNIHLNKTLSSLRSLGLVVVTGRHVQFIDAPSLTQMTDFDASYLDFS